MMQHRQQFGSMRRRITWTFVLTGLLHIQAVSEIRVYFNRSVDSTFATPGNVAKGNVDLRAKLVARIDSATYSIDMCMYSIDIDSIASHIIAAKNRGVRIRVVYENRNDQPPIITLRNNGIQIMKRKDNNGLMHNKFFVFDARDSSTTAPWIWTGSWNVTQAQQGTDYNNVIEIRNRPLALAYTKEFEEMWGSSTDNRDSVNAKFGSQKTNNTPHIFTIDGKAVELYFSPSDGTNARIISKISASNASIRFSLLSFTRQDIVSAMRARYLVGATVRGIMENIDVQATWDSLVTFAQMWRHTPSGLFHHKYAILDEGAATPILITGSHNWSTNAETSNDENTLIVYDAALSNQYLQEFQKRVAELTSSVGGIVYNDLNGNGIRDVGEPGLPGWTVNLTGQVTASTITDDFGNYTFSSLPFGLYTIAEAIQAGWTQTAPMSPPTYSVTIAGPTSLPNYHFGNSESGSTAISSVNSGNWSTPSVWSGGAVPGPSHSVIISAGHTVTIDGNVASSLLSVNGILQFDNVAGRTLTVVDNLTINTGGHVRASAPFTSGSTAQTILLGGSFTNNGTLSARVSGSSSGNRDAAVIFNGNGPSAISGTAATSFFMLTMNMASSSATLTPNMNVGFVTNVANALTLTRGTWVQSTAMTSTPNVNITVDANSALSISGEGSFGTGAASLLVNGSLNVSGGSLIVGNGNNRLEVLGAGSASFDGGTVTIGGRLTLSGGSTTINGTDIRLNPRGSTTLGGASNVFEAASAASLTMTGGSITIVNPKAVTSTGREIKIVAGSGSKTLSGGMFYLGDAVSTIAGSDTGFVIESPIALPSLTLQTGGTAGRNVTLASTLSVSDLILESGTLGLSGAFPSGFDLTVRGSLTRSNGGLAAGQRTVTILAPSGGGQSSIIGEFTGADAFYTLVISNTDGLALAGSIEVRNAIPVIAGTVVTGGFSVILGGTATLSEPLGNPIVGTVRTTRSVVQNETATFGEIGIELTPSGGSPGETTVLRRTGTPSTSGGSSILRYFDVSPAHNFNLDATLVFRYDPSEVNANTQSMLRLWESTDAGSTWSFRGGTVDTIAHMLTVAGIPSLSRWTAADTLHFGSGVSTAAYPFSSGWNLISLPLDVARPLKSELFPTSTSPAFRFLSGSGYVPNETLSVGVAYWLKFGATQTVTISGLSIMSDSIPVTGGWNMIGTISDSLNVASIQQVPPGIVVSAFFGYDGQYIPVTVLTPGRGYWVKVNQNGILLLNSSSLLSSNPRPRVHKTRRE
jgi:hypothetical protein